jgi:hypothetical protein
MGTPRVSVLARELVEIELVARLRPAGRSLVLALYRLPQSF